MTVDKKWLRSLKNKDLEELDEPSLKDLVKAEIARRAKRRVKKAARAKAAAEKAAREKAAAEEAAAEKDASGHEAPSAD